MTGDKELFRPRFLHQFAHLERARLSIDMRRFVIDDFGTHRLNSP